MKILTPQAGVNIQDMKKLDLMGHLYRVSEKIDGVRRIFYKNKEGEVSAVSRTHKPDTWLDHICTFFEGNKFMYDTYYDCELVDREAYFTRAESFELRTKTNSKASQEYSDNKRDLMAICFDYFCPNKANENTMVRTRQLQHMFTYCSLEDPVILVPIFGNVKGESIVLINKLADQVMRIGGEGIMLQDCDLPYIQGRGKHLIKVKRREEFIGTIIGVEMAMPGTKIENGARAVTCTVEQCTQPVRVGSGFNDDERYYIGSYQSELIGEKIEIEAFGVSQNSRGETSLSMPIFKRFCNSEHEGIIHHFEEREGMDIE